MTKVINIDPTERFKEQKKEEFLEILNEIRNQIESGYIESLVAASLNTNGEYQIYAHAADLVTGVGLFELGKQMLLNKETQEK